MQEKVYQTSWNIGWFRCGQSWSAGPTIDIIAVAIRQWRYHLNACDTCVKAQGGYFKQHLHYIYMKPFGLSDE